VGEFFFEGFSLDIDRRELKRGSDLVAIEPQVFDLLAYLVKNRERVLTKDDLMTAVWDGRVVSESTLTSRVNSVRKAVGDTGREQRLIRTYARKGIRFVGEIRESRNNPDTPTVPEAPIKARGKPCIAVLPFANLGGDTEQDYFSDGITEDIITAMSKNHSLLVIARNSTFAFRGQSSDVHRIGLDLGAGYLVQGSVRRIGSRVRITARLAETEGGRTLWAEQYDRGIHEIFEVQDEITATIAARLEPEVGIAERSRADKKPPQTFDAWDFFRLGTKHFYESTADDNRKAQRLFRRAIGIDPTLGEAHGFLSYAIVLSMIYFDAEPDDALLDEAVEIAKKGVALDERDATVRFMYGRALLARGAYGNALGELEAAIELNPNLAVAYCGLGDSLAYEGRVSEAIPYFQRAINLSPHDPMRWAFYSYRALAHLFAQQFELAEEWAHKATRIPNCHYWGYAHRVAALGHLQRTDESGVALTELLKINPSFNCNLARRRLFYLKDPSQIALYIDGLRRSGVPEGPLLAESRSTDPA
jgi:TolB-like protein